MPWGYDEWLVDRKARRAWMRSIALVGLIEQVLRTPAGAREALSCVLDEVLGDAASSGPPFEGSIEQDVERGGEWLTAAFAAARAEGVPFQSLVLLLPDSAPYRLRLALVDGPVRVASDWRAAIRWRAPADFTPTALTGLLTSFAELPTDVRGHADFAVPLAYTAFLLRDVLRLNERARVVREALVTYDGGDSVGVPIS